MSEFESKKRAGMVYLPYDGQPVMKAAPIRVLLVEDSPSDAQLLQDHLESTAENHFGFTHCENLREALEHLNKGLFDVLLLDLSLPDSSGRETFLQARAAAPMVPIILLTGLDDEALGIEAVRHDIQDYIVKGQADGRQIARSIRYAIERKRAQEQLRLQAAALQSAANAILITNYEGIIMWVNAAFTRLTGYNVQEIVGQNPRLLKSGLQDAAFYQGLWGPIQAGQPWHGELINKRKDGTLYIDETTITPLTDPRGKITHFIAVKQDVTDRKQAENSLRFQARMLDTVGQAVIATDLDRRITYWNEAAAQLFGWSKEEVLGKVLAEVLPPQASCETLSEITAALTSGNGWSGEFAVRNREGGLVELHTTNTPMCDEKGTLIGYISIGLDLTERKRMEDALRRAHDELEERVRERTSELVTANAALQREIAQRHSLEAQLVEIAEAEQRRIGRDLHDGLCQQLAGIAYLCSVTQERLARNAPAEAGAMAQITRLIQESNSQAHGLTLGLNPVNLAADGLMVALQNLVANLHKLYAIPTHFDCSEPVLLRDHTAATHLYRIAQEALSNAAKHARATQIILRLTSTAELLSLVVKDNGVGIISAHTRGTGMGLETMRFRARSIGATLSIENNARQGTVVNCTLPLKTLSRSQTNA